MEEPAEMFLASQSKPQEDPNIALIGSEMDKQCALFPTVVQSENDV